MFVSVEYMSRVCVILKKPEENAGSPGGGVIGSCEPLGMNAGSGTGVLEEQQVLLTTVASLQSPRDFVSKS